MIASFAKKVELGCYWWKFGYRGKFDIVCCICFMVLISGMMFAAVVIDKP